jgi:hypothetical protein
MTSSTRCSRNRHRAAATLLAALCAACAGSRAPGARGPWPGPEPGRARIALFPIENLSATPVPTRDLLEPLAAALARAGVDVVFGAPVDAFLERHRIRVTGSLDAAGARAARNEMRVDGVALTSLELYSTTGGPQISLLLRVVAAGDAPEVVWMEGVAMTGQDEPGLLDLGVVDKIPPLQREALARLAQSLGAFAAGRPPSLERCPAERRFRPRVTYRSKLLDRGGRFRVAVLPFVNETPRRFAGEAIALHLVRALVAAPRFDVVEPGVVRDQMLEHRIILERGLSLTNARDLFRVVDADLVLVGEVREYAESGGAGGAPAVHFTVRVLDRNTETMVWESTSYNRGDDGVFFFGQGRITTVAALTCRMARHVVDRMAGRWRPRAPEPGAAGSASSPAGR